MLRTDKERVVAELAERLRQAETLLIADYRGLTHKELDEVRTELLKSGARFSVVKNSLTKRAAAEAGVDALDEFLEGPTAIAFVSDGDMVAVAKTLADTAQRTRRMSLKGGILQGRPIDAAGVRELATLPPADVLRGQLLGAIVGPVSAIVNIFAAPLRDFVGVLDARIRQLEERGETAPASEEPPAAETDGAPADAPAAEAEGAEAPTAEAEAPAEAEAEARDDTAESGEAAAEEPVSEQAQEAQED